MEFFYFAAQYPLLFKFIALVIACISIKFFLKLIKQSRFLNDPSLSDADNSGLELAVVIKREHGIWLFMIIYGGLFVAIVTYLLPVISLAIIS